MEPLPACDSVQQSFRVLGGQGNNGTPRQIVHVRTESVHDSFFGQALFAPAHVVSEVKCPAGKHVGVQDRAPAGASHSLKRKPEVEVERRIADEHITPPVDLPQNRGVHHEAVDARVRVVGPVAGIDRRKTVGDDLLRHLVLGPEITLPLLELQRGGVDLPYRLAIDEQDLVRTLQRRIHFDVKRLRQANVRVREDNVVIIARRLADPRIEDVAKEGQILRKQRFKGVKLRIFRRRGPR